MPSPTVTLRDATHPLTADEAAAVLRLAARAAEADGSEPLSEQFRLSVRNRDHYGVQHLLAIGSNGEGTGYAQARLGEGPPSGELVVSPAARRSGVGTALLAA